MFLIKTTVQFALAIIRVDYVKNEMKYVLKESPVMLPVALMRDMIKYVAYKMQ